MTRGKFAAIVCAAIVAVPLSATPASASEGSYAGGVVTLNAAPGETDVNFVVSTYSFEPGAADLLISSYRTDLSFVSPGACVESGSGYSCRNAPVSAVRVNGGAGEASVTVLTFQPAAVDVVSGAASGNIEIGGPGVVSTVTGANGPDNVEIGIDDEFALGAATVTALDGDDSVTYASLGSGSLAADLGTGNDYAAIGGTPTGGTVVLGDGNDEFNGTAVVPQPITVDGGTGDDAINFMLGPVRAAGGAGNDVFEPDKNQTPPLSGGLPAEPSAGDVILGGAGKDTIRLDSPGRTAKVRISLDGKANDGQAGERDNYGKDVENLWIRYVSAIVTGSKAPNVIELLDGGTIRGLDGNDHLIGGTVLIGGGGKDRLDGGSDTRAIKAIDGKRDRITCGDGAEIVYADKLDIIEKKGCAKIVRR